MLETIKKASKVERSPLYLKSNSSYKTMEQKCKHLWNVPGEDNKHTRNIRNVLIYKEFEQISKRNTIRMSTRRETDSKQLSLWF